MDMFRYFLRSRLGLAVSAIAAAAGAYLLATHTGHALAALPYLFLLACPLMHLFGHRHHRAGHGSPEGRSPESR